MMDASHLPTYPGLPRPMLYSNSHSMTISEILLRLYDLSLKVHIQDIPMEYADHVLTGLTSLLKTRFYLHENSYS